MVTTGGQIIESVEELRKLGANASLVLCVSVREKKAFQNLADTGLTLRALLGMDDLAKYA